MSLLDKFSTVEIKADDRISEKDRAFCRREQEAFDKSGPALEQLADLFDQLYAEQREILALDGGEFYDPYLHTARFRFSPDDARCATESRNSTFIERIVDYFSRTYNVELNVREIQEHLIPEKPSDSFFSDFRFRHRHNSLTDEDEVQFDAKYDEYKKQVAEHTDLIRHLPLRYEQVVDEIITQLGGFSFQERSMNEFMDRVWRCSHNTYRSDNEEEFEVKNSTLRLLPHCSWLYTDENKWMTHPETEYKPQDDLRTMAEALAHFECGRMKEGRLWYPELCEYSTKQDSYACHHHHVDTIKFFKNGRVDIKFRSAAGLQEFVEKYLRRRTA